MNNINIMPFHSKGYEQTEIKTISSREVAEMMEIKEHSKMIRKIEQINEVLNEAKIGLVEYWFESTYVDGKGETRKEYQVTKKGCEMLAHKSTGNKGILFTHKYMERFGQMEKVLQNSYAHLSKEFQAITDMKKAPIMGR